jgi:hypothetical protein
MEVVELVTFYSQGCHAHGKPEVLLAEDVPAAKVPLPSHWVVRVTENGKDPWDEAVSIYRSDYYGNLHPQVRTRPIQPTKRWCRSKTL